MKNLMNKINDNSNLKLVEFIYFGDYQSRDFDDIKKCLGFKMAYRKIINLNDIESISPLSENWSGQISIKIQNYNFKITQNGRYKENIGNPKIIHSLDIKNIFEFRIKDKNYIGVIVSFCDTKTLKQIKNFESENIEKLKKSLEVKNRLKSAA